MLTFLASGIFWGIVLILLGISVIIKVAFNVDIHLFRILFAVLFIAVGVEILLNGQGWKGAFNSGQGILFGEGRLKWDTARQKNEYNVLFGKGDIDLTEVPLTNGKAELELNTIFGASFVTLNESLPVRITVDSAFAGAIMPDGSTVAFGSQEYKTPAYGKTTNSLEIRAHVVFGSIKFTVNK